MNEEILNAITASGRHLLVDENGNVFKKTKNGAKPLKKFTWKGGYEYVCLSVNGKRKKLSVHRLVATVFHNNPDNLPQVNHIDGNPRNNCADNLEWVNGSDNQLHSRYVLGNKTGFADRPVVCLDTGEKYISTRDAWKKTGVHYSHISECARGKRKTAGGRRWKYAPLGKHL